MQSITQKEIDRFWGKVDKSDGCWIIKGSSTPFGHKYFHFNNRSDYGHRFAWILHYGPIPSGMFICHHCDNPACVRPDHLFLGSATDNVRDAARKGRMPKGDNHHATKISDKDVAIIRARYARGGILQKDLCAEYNISPGAMCMLLSGKTRK